MRVLHITYSFLDTYEQLSGIFFEEQTEALRKYSEVKIDVISVNLISLKSIFRTRKLDFKLRKISTQNGQNIILQVPSIPFVKSFNRWTRNKILWILFSKYIKKNGLPDLIHIQTYHCTGVARKIKSKFNVPYIVTEHFSVFARNLTNKREDRFAEKGFKQADLCIAVSPAFCKLLTDRFKVNFIYVPNVIDTELFRIKNFNKDLSRKNFINVGSLDDNKNHSLLINAFARIDDKNTCLHIVGEGPLKEELINLVEKLGLKDRVFFHGRQTKEQICDLYNLSHCFVLTSKYETFGIAPLEAMACGLPVIATRCGGPESYLINEKLGFLCDLDVKDVAEKMSMAIQKSFDSQYIRQYVVDNFSPQSFALKMKKIYDGIISHKSF